MRIFRIIDDEPGYPPAGSFLFESAAADGYAHQEASPRWYRIGPNMAQVTQAEFDVENRKAMLAFLGRSE